jgi:hypothetical protein
MGRKRRSYSACIYIHVCIECYELSIIVLTQTLTLDMIVDDVKSDTDHSKYVFIPRTCIRWALYMVALVGMGHSGVK